MHNNFFKSHWVVFLKYKINTYGSKYCFYYVVLDYILNNFKTVDLNQLYMA